MSRALIDAKAVLDLIHVGYQEPTGAWAERLLPLLRTVLPHTAAAGFYQFRAKPVADGVDFRVASPLSWYGEPLYNPEWLSFLENIAPAVADTVFPRTMATMSSVHALEGQPLPSLPSWQAMWRPSVRDSLGLVFRDPSGRGFVLFTADREETKLTARESALLTKLVMHLGAAYRLERGRAAAVGRLDDAEAIFSPSGTVLHATGVASTRTDSLADGRRRRDEAMRRGQDIEKALEVWRGLVGGRWSLVDHVDTDGKRFLLAMKNAPRAAPATDLSPRERRVCALAAMGHRDKEVAYMLGLTLASVSAAMHRARKKLNVTSRVELAAAWKRMERTEP